jgi:hypothetical protein
MTPRDASGQPTPRHWPARTGPDGEPFSCRGARRRPPIRLLASFPEPSDPQPSSRRGTPRKGNPCDRAPRASSSARPAPHRTVQAYRRNRPRPAGGGGHGGGLGDGFSAPRRRSPRLLCCDLIGPFPSPHRQRHLEWAVPPAALMEWLALTNGAMAAPRDRPWFTGEAHEKRATRLAARVGASRPTRRTARARRWRTGRRLPAADTACTRRSHCGLPVSRHGRATRPRCPLSGTARCQLP